MDAEALRRGVERVAVGGGEVVLHVLLGQVGQVVAGVAAGDGEGVGGHCGVGFWCGVACGGWLVVRWGGVVVVERVGALRYRPAAGGGMEKSILGVKR